MPHLLHQFERAFGIGAVLVQRLGILQLQLAQALLVGTGQGDAPPDRAAHGAQDRQVGRCAVNGIAGAHLAHFGDLGKVALGQVRQRHVLEEEI
ncbi:hypothetical protein D9M69_639020 [compost metagenome]